MAFMSGYEFPSSNYYDDDLRELISLVRKLDESYDTLVSQISTLTTNFETLQNNFDTIQTEFTSIKTDFDALSTKVDEMYQYIDSAIADAVASGIRAAMVQFRQEFLGYIETLQNDFDALQTLVEQYYASAKAYADTQDDVLRNEFNSKFDEIFVEFNEEIDKIWAYLDTLGLNINNPYRSYKPDTLQNVIDDVFNITDSAQSFNIFESRAYGLTCNDYRDRNVTCSETHNDLRYKFADYFYNGKKHKYDIWSGKKVNEWLADYHLAFYGKGFNNCTGVAGSGLTCDDFVTNNYSCIDTLTLQF